MEVSREYESYDGEFTDPFWVPHKKKHIPFSVVAAFQVVNVLNHLQPQQREDHDFSTIPKVIEEEFPYWWFDETLI